MTISSAIEFTRRKTLLPKGLDPDRQVKMDKTDFDGPILGNRSAIHILFYQIERNSGRYGLFCMPFSRVRPSAW